MMIWFNVLHRFSSFSNLVYWLVSRDRLFFSVITCDRESVNITCMHCNDVRNCVKFISLLISIQQHQSNTVVTLLQSEAYHGTIYQLDSTHIVQMSRYIILVQYMWIRTQIGHKKHSERTICKHLSQVRQRFNNNNIHNVNNGVDTKNRNRTLYTSTLHRVNDKRRSYLVACDGHGFQ